MNLPDTLKTALTSAMLCTGLMGVLPNTVLAQKTSAANQTNRALPAESLYWLSVPLTDGQGKHFDLRDLAGRPALVTMFYGDCNTACPIVLENLQQTVAALKPLAGGLRVLMVSLDPLHDTPASLAKLGQTHHLDNAVFRLAVSTDESHTRAMAAAFNVKYRLLNGGEINHTTRISLLDAEGKLIASSTQLSATPDQEFLKKIRLALKS